MNPLHRPAPQAEALVPEAHGYGYVAASEAAPPQKTPSPPAPAPGTGATASTPTPESPRVPAPAPPVGGSSEAPAATAATVLSPLVPNIGTSTMARLLGLSEAPLEATLPAGAVRLLVIDATEKGVAAVQAHIEHLKKAQAPVLGGGSVTSLEGLDGIVVIPAGPGRAPRPVRLRLKVLAGAVPVLMCPWVPALAGRLADDAALAKAAAVRPVAAAVTRLTAQIGDLTG